MGKIFFKIFFYLHKYFIFAETFINFKKTTKMKKLTMFAAVAVLALSFASCKKNYTCSCTGGTAGSDISYTAKLKKKDAKTWCDGWNSSFKSAYTSGSCTLK
jgi:hypothetical protein